MLLKRNGKKKSLCKKTQPLKLCKGWLSPLLVYSGFFVQLQNKILQIRTSIFFFLIDFFSLPEYASHKTAKFRVGDKGSQVNLVIPLVKGLFSQKLPN